MTEIVGLALLLFAVVAAAIAYLVVHYLRYRWELEGMREEVKRLNTVNLQLREENEWLKRAAGIDKD